MTVAPHKCSGVTHVYADCQDCEWSSGARNAMGNAARHANAYGHHVTAEQVISVGFNCTADHAKARTMAPDAAGAA